MISTLSKHEIIDRDELNDSFSPDVTLINFNQNCLLKTKSLRFENPKSVIVSNLNTFL